MKKKILCFIFAFIFMFPFAFMLSGCFGEQPPSDPPPTEQGGNGDQDGDEGEQPAALTVSEFLADFNNATLTNNYTAVFNAEYTQKQYDVENNVSGAGKTEGLSLPSVYLTVDNKNVHINIPTRFDAYMVGNVVYEKDFDYSEENYYYVNYTNKDCYADYYDVFANINKVLDKKVINTLIDFSNTLNKDSVTIEEKDNQYILTININSSLFTNKSVTNLLTNGSKKIKDLLNTLYKDYTGIEADILAVIEEFEQSFTDETTLEDLINFINTKAGCDFDSILNYLYAAFNVYYRSSQSFQEWNHLQDFEELFGIFGDNYSGSIDLYQLLQLENLPTLTELGYNDDLKQTPIVDYVDTSESELTAKELFFNELDNLLNNDDVTLNAFLQSSLTEEEFNDYTTLLEDLKGFNNKENKLDIQITFNSDYNIANLKLDGTFDYSFVDTKTKDGSGEKYTASVNIAFSDIGKTSLVLPKVDMYYIDANFYLSPSDIENLSSKYITSFSVQNLDIPSFTINGYEYDDRTGSYLTTPINFLSYNSSTKLLSINSTYILEALSVEDCNCVSYSINLTDSDLTLNISIIVEPE